MKISVDKNSSILLEEVFNCILLKTTDGEDFSICMRDSGFEFKYEGVWYSAQNGNIKEMKLSSRGNILVDQSDKNDMDNAGTGY